MKLIRKCEQWLKLWATADASDEKVSTAQNQVKKALIQTYFTSLLCLVLCVTMFLGTTYAWFTSEVNNEGNEIYIGTLDVELEKLNKVFTDENDKWLSLSETDANGQNNTKLFDSGIRWEPGYTALETVRITNEGDLAFKYLLSFTDGKIVKDENDTQTAAEPDESAELEELRAVAENFEVYVHAGELEAKPADFEAIVEESEKEDGKWTRVGNLADVLEGKFVFEGNMDQAAVTATEKTFHTYTIALHMSEATAGEDMMGKKISLNVKLVAHQTVSEQDAFGNQYAPKNIIPVANTEELQAALNNAKDEDVIALMAGVTYEEVEIKAPFADNVTITGATGAVLKGIAMDLPSFTPQDPAEGLTLKGIAFKSKGFYCKNVTNTAPWGFIKNLTLDGCSFEGDNRDDVLGNRLFDIGGDSTGSHQCINLKIRNCTVKTAIQGIRAGSLRGECVISGNTITDVAHNGITLRSVQEGTVLVKGNKLSDGGDRAFRIGVNQGLVKYVDNTIVNCGDPDDDSNFKANTLGNVSFEGNTVDGKAWNPLVNN